MKEKYFLLFFSCCILFFSCKNGFDLQKRKYRPGFFVNAKKHSANSGNVETKKCSLNADYSNDAAVIPPATTEFTKQKINPISPGQNVSRKKIEKTISKKITLLKTKIESSAQLKRDCAFFKPKKKPAMNYTRSSDYEGLALVMLSLSLLFIILFVVFMTSDVAAMLGVCAIFFFVIGFVASGLPASELFDDHCCHR